MIGGKSLHRLWRRTRSSPYLSLLHYVITQRLALAAVFVINLAFSAIAVLQPWPLKLLIDHVLNHTVSLPASLQWIPWIATWPDPTMAVLICASGLSLLLAILNSILQILLSQLWVLIGQESVYQIGNDMLAKFFQLNAQFFRKCSPGDAMLRLSEDSYASYRLADLLILSPLNHGITLILIGMSAWRLSSSLTLIAFISMPILILLARQFGTQIRKLMRKSKASDAGLFGFSLQVMKAMPLVQSYQVEDLNSNVFLTKAETAVCHAKRHALFSGLVGLSGNFVGASLGALIMALGAAQVVRGEISLGSMIVIMNYLDKIRGATNGLFNTFTRLKSLDASVERLGDVLQAPIPCPEPEHPVVFTGNGPSGEIHFKGISHCYQADSKALDQIHLHISAGEKVAIVGPTGAGKSSLIACLLRFFDPDHGSVCIDGIDIKRLAFRDLRSCVGYLPQLPRLAETSISKNIGYFDAHPREASVVAAARIAQAHEFISSLPDGYATVIGSQGANLSGGQKQRIALARALYRNAPILILDEPTSALDPGTEQELISSFQQAMQGRTVLMIAHRLATVRKMDRIVVMSAGEIVESGSHDQLIQANGVYASMQALHCGESSKQSDR